MASHSFAPVLDKDVRRADVACLYDPRRQAKSGLTARWLTSVARRTPNLRLRRNYPYQGRSDGVAALLRKRFPLSREGFSDLARASPLPRAEAQLRLINGVYGGGSAQPKLKALAKVVN